MSNALLTEALAALTAGLSPIPILPATSSGEKRPALSWKPFQSARATPEQVADWFTAHPSWGLGIVCGQVSGNLVMLEVEGRAMGQLPQVADIAHNSGLGEVWERLFTGWSEATPGGGIHLYLRTTTPPAGNTRIARRPATPDELATTPGDRIKVLAETRGEGGYTVIAPTPGTHHHTGRGWVRISGGPATIPTLSGIELEAVMVVLGAVLDQMPHPDPDPQPAPAAAGDQQRPGDQYEAATSWAEILTPHGWTAVFTRGTTTYWRRPGKTFGISATTGHATDRDRLFVFSTSTPFDAGVPITKYHAYTVLTHGGDHKAAAKALAEAGYGGTVRPDTGPALTLIHGGGGTERSTPAPVDGNTALAPVTQLGPRTDNLTLARYGATEDGLAQALVDRHGHEIRYCPQQSLWLTWDGHRWKRDEGGAHREHIKSLARQLPDNDDWKTHRKKMLTATGVTGVAKMAASDPRVVVDAARLDADPWILNTPSGLVDLRTGKARPVTPDDLCTRLTGASYDPDATAPRWEAFLAETFDGDTEIIDYLARLIGYSACGAVTHHVLPFAFGVGGAGKSVVLDVAIGVLGDYASTAPTNFLMAGRNDESAIARLAGLRMVVCSEVNADARFDEAKVKLLTGGDKLTSRFLFGQYFTFTPTHHLWLMGNHQPRVEAGGDSFWRRLRVLPFTRAVPPERRIEGFAEQLLEAEAPGILTWIVNGCIDALTNGMREPDRVMTATATYAEEEDHLSRFIEEIAMLTSSGREKASAVRETYVAWCRAEGLEPVSNQILVRELRTRWRVNTAKSHGVRYYTGLTLLDNSDPAEDESDPRLVPWTDR